MAKVGFDTAGNPAGVERLGLVQEPQEVYERAGPNAGGVEDPRITYLPLLDSYQITASVLLAPSAPSGGMRLPAHRIRSSPVKRGSTRCLGRIASAEVMS